jgi:1-acyl-sn-glycerol-3-phosphate acyltransferase
MVIFPEGTRNKTDDILLNFHAGSFKIAQRAKCPIVVVALTNTDTISMNLKRNDIYMDVVKVYTPEEVVAMNTVDLANETSELIKKQYLLRKEGK